MAFCVATLLFFRISVGIWANVIELSKTSSFFSFYNDFWIILTKAEGVFNLPCDLIHNILTAMMDDADVFPVIR